jgi:hypothetical protein
MEVFKPKRDLNCLARFSAIFRRIFSDFCRFISKKPILPQSVSLRRVKAVFLRTFKFNGELSFLAVGGGNGFAL